MVVQKGTPHFLELVAGLELILEDIKVRSDRHNKCVVTMSLGADGVAPPEDMRRLRGAIEGLFRTNTPMFVAAGNEALRTPDVDTYPALSLLHNFPWSLLAVLIMEVGGRISLRAVRQSSFMLPVLQSTVQQEMVR